MATLKASASMLISSLILLIWNFLYLPSSSDLAACTSLSKGFVMLYREKTKPTGNKTKSKTANTIKITNTVSPICLLTMSLLRLETK